MRIQVLGLLPLLLLVAVVPANAAEDLEAPVALEAAEGPIDVTVGHAAPFLHDLDGDGRLDLLLGDMLVELGPERELDDAERQQKERDQQRLTWVQRRYGPAYRRVQDRVLESSGREGAWHEVWAELASEERAALSRRLREELARDVEASALQRMMREAAERSSHWMPERTIRGRVWLLRRAP
jgi:hypothetical protein